MRILSSLAFVATLVASNTAFAQANANCPPGSWFCADAPSTPSTTPGTTPPAAPPAAKGAPLAPLPPPEASGPAASGAGAPPPVVYQNPPPVIVYETTPPPVVVVKPRPTPPVYVYDPRTAPFKPEFGLNLHLGAVSVGNSDSGMGLAGIGFRFRPARALAIEADLDAAGGRDYYRNARSEGSFSLNGIVFLNPRSATQVYLIGGAVWSGADVSVGNGYGFYSPRYTTHYSYFGGQAGVGLEFRLSKLVALNTDVRGLLRARTDASSSNDFEFRQGNKGTNTSGAGIFNVGLTFYF